MNYSFVYPWAKHDVLRETSIFTSLKRVKRLCHVVALSRSGVETNVVIIPCASYESICKDCQGEESFCFFYKTFFTKLNVRLPLSFFEKDVLNTHFVSFTKLSLPNSVFAFHYLFFRKMFWMWWTLLLPNSNLITKPSSEPFKFFAFILTLPLPPMSFSISLSIELLNCLGPSRITRSSREPSAAQSELTCITCVF